MNPNPPATPDVFDQFNPEKVGDLGASSPSPAQKKHDPFDDFDPVKVGDLGASKTSSSAMGSFARGAERGVLPATGGLAGAGAGLEVGAALGAIAGPIGSTVGGLGGALAGGLLGSTALSSAQNWALSKLPDSWREAIGMNDRQEQIDQKEHGTAAFIGGIAPYLMTMTPMAAARAIPENATAMQKILAHPATARVFGGAVMGGMELGQEAVSPDPVDWSKVAIATGFGVVFNRPNRIGERLTEVGAQPARRALEPTPEAAPAEQPQTQSPEGTQEPAATPEPEVTEAKPTRYGVDLFTPPAEDRHFTVADASDANVMGPGVTQETFEGSHGRDESASLAAQEAKRTERATIGAPEQPDVHAVARRMHPELFTQYEELTARRNEFRKWIDEFNNPPEEEIAAAKSRHDELASQLESHVAERNGYAGGKEARQLRAQVREAQSDYEAISERAQAFSEGRGQNTEELATARQHLMKTDEEMRDLVPEISAAYRRAADAAGSETVPAEVTPAETATPPTPETAVQEPVAGTQPEPSGAQLVPEQNQSPPTVPAIEPTTEPATTQALTPGHENALRAAGLPVPPHPIEQQRAAISSDVERQLLSAGRPPEEAKASAALIAAYYETRAARFNGALGSAEDLYRAEGAEILGEGKRTQQPRGIPQQRAPRKVNEEALSLFQFLAHRGGLKPNADLQHTLDGNPFVPGFGKLLREDGMSLDRAREAAVEAGYLHDTGRDTGGESESRINHLLDAVREEAHGTKQFRAGREAPESKVDAGEEAHRIGAEIDAAYEKEKLPPPKGETRDRAIEMMRSGAVRDPFDAVERASMSEEYLQSQQQIHSPEFQEWFGDSKVKREGEPAIVYHGTSRAGFDAFDTYASNYGLMGQGGYFTENPAVASTYTTKGIKNIERRGGEPSQGVYPAYLAIKKPIDMDAQPDHAAWAKAFPEYLDHSQIAGLKTNEAVLRELEETLQQEMLPKHEGAEIVQDGLRGMGFDGITHVGGGRVDSDGPQHRVWIAFDPEQIKSAIGNRGTFDAASPNILHQGVQGKIRIAQGRRPIITLMKDANESTFIHETGHEWLEQLMRDAGHEAAPPSLRDDADTVQRWLGVHSAEDIKTKQHEKFARGFEQYMREGVAPSAKLAKVFAQFKSWLTTIYKTIKGLGAPIDADIRSVFDHMLNAEPQRTVIAGERENPVSIANEHEIDARLTEPHEAEAVMARVDQERALAYSDMREDIRSDYERFIAEKAQSEAEGNEPGAGIEPPAEGGAVSEGRGELEPVRGPEGSPAGQGSGSAQHGAKRASVGKSGSKGAGVSDAGERSGTGKEPESVPLAPTPATQFGPAESPFTDKAGNIRLENLTNIEDVRQAVRDAAEENNDFVGDRRGVVTDGQIMDAAEAAGMEGALDIVKARIVGQGFSAEQVMTLRKALIQSATEVSASMKKAATGSDEDVLAYAMTKDRHQMIQATLAGATAETGRALRAFRSIAGQEQTTAVDQFIKGATGKTLFQLRMEAKMGAQLDTPGKVSKYLHDAQKRTFGKMILEYWINGLISGPATHTTYMMGNAILAAEKAGLETPVASLIGTLRARMGREGAHIRMGEVGAQFKGAIRNLPAALEAGIEATRSGMTTLLPGEQARPLIPFSGDAQLTLAKNSTNEPVTWADLGAHAFSSVRGLRDGLMAGAALVKAGGEAGAPAIGFHYSPLGQIPDIAIRGVPVVPLGSAIRLPGRFIAAIHSFFRSTNYAMEKSAQAYRAASEEGLQGTAFDARVGELWQNPTEEIMEVSRHEATEMTLMGQGSAFVQALGRLTNTPILGFPLLKFVDPFVHIAGNIIDQSIIKRTPVGILAPEIRADLMGRNGNVAQDMAMARMLVGSALSVTFGGLAAQGLISGSGPSDPRQAAMWRMAGNQAHSVRVGDTWYQVNKLGPMGMLLGLSADLYDVAHEAGEGEFLEAGAHLHHAITQNVLDESFMRGPAELMRAIEDPGRYGEGYIRNFLSSFVPYSVGLAQIARASDPYARQAKTVIDAMKAKVPGMSESLFPRRDIWGEPMASRDALGMAGVTAIYAQQVSKDPVNLALLDLGISPAQPERKIRNVDLTEQQYDDFARLSGRMTKQRLDVIVRSPDFRTWPNHIKATVITEVVRQSREAARGLMMMKNPQIVKDATAAKLEKFRD